MFFRFDISFVFRLFSLLLRFYTGLREVYDEEGYKILQILI